MCSVCSAPATGLKQAQNNCSAALKLCYNTYMLNNYSKVNKMQNTNAQTNAQYASTVAVATLDEFVNNNKHNVTLQCDLQNASHDEIDDKLFTVLPMQFAGRVLYDTIDDAAFPVLVFVNNSSKCVAWYDCENMQGFVA